MKAELVLQAWALIKEIKILNVAYFVPVPPSDTARKKNRGFFLV